MNNEKKIQELVEQKNRIQRGADRLTDADRRSISEINKQIAALRPKKQANNTVSTIPYENTLEYSLKRIMSGELNAPKGKKYGKL